MMGKLKDILTDIFIVYPIVGIFNVVIWVEKLIQFTKKQYFKLFGIPYYEQHEKLVTIIKRK